MHEDVAVTGGCPCPPHLVTQQYAWTETKQVSVITASSKHSYSLHYIILGIMLDFGASYTQDVPIFEA